ncbi:MAG: AIPR family protein [Thermoanaerobaculia bacterium]|nr:AIPR family protein [Thermoanaerobaculia bacterium]
MNVDRIREQVRAFKVEGGYEHSPEDCFPAWYLHRRHSLPPSDAMCQASDPGLTGNEKGWDHGLDGFHIDRSDGRPRLVLIQAKYSTDLSSVRKGFKDLERLPRVLRRILDRVEPDSAKENKIFTNLRSEVNGLADDERKQLALEFLVIHLCHEEQEIVAAGTKAAQESLREEVERHLDERVFTIGHVGPSRMDFDRDSDQGVVYVPPSWTPLTLAATEMTVPYREGSVRMLHGIGKLSELVEMYVHRRDELFAKNVRYFLKNPRNTERGPAAKIRETLAAACVKKTVDPAMFGLLHNGVTIFARNARQGDGRTEVQQPFVLNGCQTIKSAYLFLNDPKIRSRIDRERWGMVAVPVRVITTKEKDETLVHEITVSTNRQNAISPAALRANDRVQLQLEVRFKERGIFYERQEGALAHVSDTSPELLDEEFENSNKIAVRIVDLGRSIAAAMGGGGLEWARHPNHIFEYDGIYQKVFAEKNLRSVVFLTFLQNLHDVLPLVLKKDVNLVKAESGAPSPSRLAFDAMALLVMYLAKSKKSDFVSRNGEERIPKGDSAFRDEVRKELVYHSGIKKALKEHFMTLGDAKTESLRSGFVAAQKQLGLAKVLDPFEAFADLDEAAMEVE